MSSQYTNNVVIDNSQYEAEIYLIRDPCADSGILPLPFSTLKYIEITNDLANIGYYGKIMFSDFNDILEQVGVLKASKKIPLLFFRLKCLEFPDSTSSYDDIFFVAALKQGQDVKENELEGGSAYNFEELFTFNLKNTRFLRTGNEDDVNSLVNENYTVDEILLEVVRMFQFKEAQGSKIADPNVLIGVLDMGTPIEDKVRLKDIAGLRLSATYYDIIEQINKFLCYKPKDLAGENNLADWYDPGVIKLENYIDADPSSPQRQIVAYPLLSTINKFFNLLSKGKPTTGDEVDSQIVPGGTTAGESRELNTTKKYFKNFLTEKFSVSQKNSIPTFSNNTIAKYELKRVDLEDVLENKWRGITITGTTEGVGSCDASEKRAYGDIRAKFEQMCTLPFKCNLPESNSDDVGVIEYNKSGLPLNLSYAYGTNSVFKSFIFDNVKVTFRIKGQTYRKPNRFISINPQPGDKTLNPIKSKEVSELDGYWYVLSVNHVFIDGNYFNDFECVKIYELGGPDEGTGAPQPTDPGEGDTSNCNGESLASGGSINGGDEKGPATGNEPALPELDTTGIDASEGPSTFNGGVLPDNKDGSFSTDPGGKPNWKERFGSEQLGIPPNDQET